MLISRKPCSQETFTKHFWVVWDKLHAAATPEAPMPTYFRFLTLLGLHMFIHEKVHSCSPWCVYVVVGRFLFSGLSTFAS